MAARRALHHQAGLSGLWRRGGWVAFGTKLGCCNVSNAWRRQRAVPKQMRSLLRALSVLPQAGTHEAGAVAPAAAAAAVAAEGAAEGAAPAAAEAAAGEATPAAAAYKGGLAEEERGLEGWREGSPAGAERAAVGEEEGGAVGAAEEGASVGGAAEPAVGALQVRAPDL